MTKRRRIHGPRPLSKGGQVVVPKALVDRMGITTGSDLYFIEESDQVILIPEGAFDEFGKLYSFPRKRQRPKS